MGPVLITLDSDSSGSYAKISLRGNDRLGERGMAGWGREGRLEASIGSVGDRQRMTREMDRLWAGAKWALLCSGQR